MTGQKKVSVIVPVYNTKDYVRQCLDSLLGQTLREIEIIVIDDGSRDGCGKIIDEYALADDRIIPVHKENGGVSAARNDGIAQITGEYVFFCDSDDWLAPDGLECLYRRAKKFSADVVMGDFCEAAGGKKRERKLFTREFVSDSPETLTVLQNTVLPKGYTSFGCRDFSGGYCLGAAWHHLIKSSLILENNLTYDTYVRGMFDDGIFMLHVFEYVKRAAYVSKVVYFYRVVETSVTHRFNPQILDTYQRVYERLDEFGRKYNKTDSYYDACYVREICYLNKAMEVYFLNAGNTGTEEERFGEFKKTAQSPPYAEAIRRVKLGSMKKVRSRLLVLLLRAKWYRFFWMIKKRLS